jgi:hypothetical protein
VRKKNLFAAIRISVFDSRQMIISNISNIYFLDSRNSDNFVLSAIWVS